MTLFQVNNKKKNKSIFNMVLVTFMVAAGLFPAADVASATEEEFNDGLPSNTTTLTSQGWSSWIGTSWVEGAETISLYCRNYEIIQASMLSTSHATDEDVASLTALTGIGLSCGDYSYRNEAIDYTVGATPSYSRLTADPSIDSDQVECNDSEGSRGMYFTVGGNIDGLGAAIQGLGMICGPDDTYYHSADIGGLDVWSEGETVGAACAHRHQVQAVRVQITETDVAPIVHAIRIKCG